MTDESPLGKTRTYSSRFDPGLLFAIPRVDSRSALGLGNDLPFNGCDIWNAWELTWLRPDGVPQVASTMIRVPAYSPNIIESKSLKLYLNSFTMSNFASTEEVRTAIENDLLNCTGTKVDVYILSSEDDCAIGSLNGICIDSTDATCDVFDVDAGLLSAGDEIVSEALHSHLLRSLCPVTNQPDIGSVQVTYRGPRIDRSSLLRYIVSFREHNDFHEACVERMFVDILQQCAPEHLSVYARYQRRGGIDINPFRSNFESEPANQRLWRQ